MKVGRQLRNQIKRTLLTYTRGPVINMALGRTEIVKKVKDVLSENNESTAMSCKDADEDLSTSFYGHSVNKASGARFNDMVERGHTLVYPGSGRAGREDGFYTYQQTGKGDDNLPFNAFQTQEALGNSLAMFSGRSHRPNVLFRSREAPVVYQHGVFTTAVFRAEDYEGEIPVEVAFAKEAGSDTVLIVSSEAVIDFLEELYDGLMAIDAGVQELTDRLNLGEIETHHAFIQVFSEKLAEESDSPVIKRNKEDLDTLLKKKYLTLTHGAEAAEILGDKGLSSRMLSLRDTLGIKAPHKAHPIDLRLYEANSSHRKHT